MKLTLRARILLVLLIIFSLLGATAYIIHSQVLLPSFLELEDQHIRTNVQRIVNALENEQHHLSLIVHDWSAWDDTYKYIVDHNPEYEASNLVDPTFPMNQLNLICLLDDSGKKVWCKAMAEDFATPITLQPFDLERFSADFPLLRLSQGHQQANGLLMTSGGPMFCTAMSIFDSNGQGSPRGTLIMGRLLSPALIDKISRLTGIVCEVKTVGGKAAAIDSGARSAETRIVRTNYADNEAKISASTVLEDMNGIPLIEINVYEAREILAQGLKALRISLLLLAVGVILALAMMLLMLQRSIVTPIRLLTRNIFKRSNSQQSPAILDIGTCASREISLLAEEFNHLLLNLDAKNAELGDINRALSDEANKLKGAEARLKKLDQLKSEFISTAAHELRTPVASIMGFTELLSDQEVVATFDEEQREECLREIYENSERLTKIVDDILDISRIEANRPIPFDKQPASIKDLLEKIVKRFKLKASHRLILDFKQGVPEILLFDAHRIGQVMENLLSNALKYSPKESTVSIIVEQVDCQCKISVIDRGIGMTDEQKTHIFDKFYRADASNTAVRGLGLGMSIVKRIIEDHGSTIWVDSVLDEGTRVYFTLPVNRAPNPFVESENNQVCFCDMVSSEAIPPDLATSCCSSGIIAPISDSW